MHRRGAQSVLPKCYFEFAKTVENALEASGNVQAGGVQAVGWPRTKVTAFFAKASISSPTAVAHSCTKQSESPHADWNENRSKCIVQW